MSLDIATPAPSEPTPSKPNGVHTHSVTRTEEDYVKTRLKQIESSVVWLKVVGGVLTVVLGTVFGLGVYSASLAKKDEVKVVVESAIKEHTVIDHPTTATKLDNLRADISTTKTEVATIRSMVEGQQKSSERIEGKLDRLVDKLIK